MICSVSDATPAHDDEEPADKAPDTAPGGNGGGEQKRDTTTSQDGGKRKRGADAALPLPTPVVNHVFQLGPSGERNALNPWFLRLLGKVKDNLEDTRGGFKMQNSWFDCSTNDKPVRDGHAGHQPGGGLVQPCEAAYISAIVMVSSKSRSLQESRQEVEFLALVCLP